MLARAFRQLFLRNSCPTRRSKTARLHFKRPAQLELLEPRRLLTPVLAVSDSSVVTAYHGYAYGNSISGTVTGLDDFSTVTITANGSEVGIATVYNGQFVGYVNLSIGQSTLSLTATGADPDTGETVTSSAVTTT